MQIPYVRGKVATQAHVGVPDGTVEEEFARNGFFGRYAHLYRTHAPVGWTRIEGPLRPRAYRALGVGAESTPSGDYLAARDELTLFFQQMHAKNPALVGGKLPDAGFYGNPGQP